MTTCTNHRLDGLEPDNLLAFMALLGLLRTLEEIRPEWRARVFWTVDNPPLRPALRVPETVDAGAITAAAAEGLDILAQHHDFSNVKDLKLNLSPEDATKALREATEDADEKRYAADLWAAMICDASLERVKNGKDKVERAVRTPLHFMSGQQEFLKYLELIPRCKVPSNRSKGQNKLTVFGTDCLHETLFTSWSYLDATQSFRWDPREDVRYALRALEPSGNKEPVQHGANRLAAIGFSIFTVVPQTRHGQVELAMRGGRNKTVGGFAFQWPIWRAPTSLACIRALLSHPGLGSRETHDALGIAEIRQARKIFGVKGYANVTQAVPEIAS